MSRFLVAIIGATRNEGAGAFAIRATGSRRKPTRVQTAAARVRALTVPGPLAGICP